MTGIRGRPAVSSSAADAAGLHDRPNILFLARSLDIGGAERQLVELATGLHARGWNVRVATFYPGGPFEEALLAADVPLDCLNKTGRWHIFGFVWRLARLVRQVKPQIAHGYLDTPNMLLSIVCAFAPKTRVVWGVRASNMKAGYDFPFLIERYLAVILSRCADLIISNSEAGRAFHCALGYPAKRMVVVPNGIDLERFRPDAAARAELRHEWGIAENHLLIGLVGRLDPMKDHETFLQAASLLTARADVRFVCIGNGPESYRESLARRALELGLGERLTWQPARKDVWRAYNALDVAVSSSSSGEGFSNTIAEAMATGLPCVVTDVGDSAALVQNLGWVCSPSDRKALAAGISSALKALPVDGARIRNHIAVNYGLDALVRRSLQHLVPLVAPLASAVGAQEPVER